MNILRANPRFSKDPKKPDPKRTCRREMQKKMSPGFGIYTAHYTHVSGQSHEGPALLEHVISINPIKNCGPNKSFDLRGRFRLLNEFIQEKLVYVRRGSQELKIRFT